MNQLNHNQENGTRPAGEDSRAAYLKPELLDMGPVADLTKSGSQTSGAEGSYS